MSDFSLDFSLQSSNFRPPVNDISERLPANNPNQATEHWAIQ